MKQIVDAVADSIAAEVAAAHDWLVVKHDPIWRNPGDGKVLAVYGTRRQNATTTANAGGDGFRATGFREDVYELVVTYSEPATEQTATLQRDEEAELDLYDVADALAAWADAHQELPEVDVWRFDYMQTQYGAEVNREAAVRYCTLTFQARKVAAYV